VQLYSERPNFESTFRKLEPLENVLNVDAAGYKKIEVKRQDFESKEENGPSKAGVGLQYEDMKI